MEIQNVKELKQLILDKINEEELKKRYEVLVAKNKLFERNKQMAYHIIATEVGADLNITFSTSAKEAFPVKIGELLDSEKVNFNISGYLLSEFRPFMTKNGKLMMFVTVADNTGIQDVAVWEEQIDNFIEGGFNMGDFVKVSNLYWADKQSFMPTFGKYSHITKVNAEFTLNEVKTNTTKQLVDGKYFTIKGIVGSLPEENKFHNFHCDAGHRLTNLTESDIGNSAMCNKCAEPKIVERHLAVSAFILADEEGQVEAEVSIFAGLDDMNVMDEYIFKGKYDNGKFKVMNVVPISKKK